MGCVVVSYGETPVNVSSMFFKFKLPVFIATHFCLDHTVTTHVLRVYVFDAHLTPASSEWVHPCLPQPREPHKLTSVASEEHCNPDNQIGPDPVP